MPEGAAPVGVDLDAVWSELVTVALLGTDRREPPELPAGAVADVVDDAVRPDGASRMIAAVGAVAAVRRAAFVAGPAAARLQPPEPDDRPWCRPDAVATWRRIVDEWPVLEDEWVLTVLRLGLRLPPDALAELLVRHRRDAVRRARVARAAGPTAAWVVDHLPVLAAATGDTAVAADVDDLPALPVSPELAGLLDADAHTVTRRLVAGFEASGFGSSHRAVLVNLLARCRPAVLPHAAEGLDHVGLGLAVALADLARLRHRMLVELGVAV